MNNSLIDQSITKLHDLSAQQIHSLLNKAAVLKKDKNAGIEQKRLTGKIIALIFDEDSINTRAGFEIALHDQGGHVSNLGLSKHHFGEQESVRDTARVLGKHYDAIEYRGNDQTIIEILSRYSGVPVYNGLTDQFHPTQALADILTMQEHSGKSVSDISVCFVGDTRNSVGNSLMLIAAKLGIDLRICGPECYWPADTVIRHAYDDATRSDSILQLTENIDDAVKGCDFIYTEGWLQSTEESQWQSKYDALKPYQVDVAMMAKTETPDTKFMHCLPAFHNNDSVLSKRYFDMFNETEVEVTDDVFESENSIVFDQASNRVHTIKSLLISTLCDE